VAKQQKQNKVGALRIIGGQWRGRKLAVADVEGLRPTGDRVRETLFNWLQPYLPGSRCLDCFAGSGALGLEAASRGAEYVTMVEANSQAASHLKAHCDTLQAQNCHVLTQTAEQASAGLSTPFDIVFMDPPFQADLWSSTAQLLMTHSLLAEGALIYVEYPRRMAMPKLPEQWQQLKEKQAGEVNYALFQYSAGASV
jgi:16S rRNA (guanine966-N2)-methyltransferase